MKKGKKIKIGLEKITIAKLDDISKLKIKGGHGNTISRAPCNLYTIIDGKGPALNY